MKFRHLKANEIECRVQSCGKVGVKLLLYKTARVDMDILDETVGAENWQCKYDEAKGILFCSLGINVNYGVPDSERWIWKEDAGSESNMEAEKGNASDAFKRAGFRWGIGRELYTAPEIFVFTTDNKDGSPNAMIKSKGKDNFGKEAFACYDNFSVEKIAYNGENKIIGLAIRNDSLNKRVYVWQAEK